MRISVSGNYTLIADPTWKNVALQKIWLECDTRVVPTNIQLPEIADFAGFNNVEIYIIDKYNQAGTRNITVTRAGADTIDGGSTAVINQNGGGLAMTIYSDTQWGAEGILAADSATFQKIVIVDGTYGVDATAVKYNTAKPYKTLAAAVAAAAAGDTIQVNPGTYSLATSIPAEVHLHCLVGASITFNALVFNGNATQINNRITGNGDLTFVAKAALSNVAGGNLLIEADNITITADDIFTTEAAADGFKCDIIAHKAITGTQDAVYLIYAKGINHKISITAPEATIPNGIATENGAGCVWNINIGLITMTNATFVFARLFANVDAKVYFNGGIANINTPLTTVFLNAGAGELHMNIQINQTGGEFMVIGGATAKTYINKPVVTTGHLNQTGATAELYQNADMTMNWAGWGCMDIGAGRIFTGPYFIKNTNAAGTANAIFLSNGVNWYANNTRLITTGAPSGDGDGAGGANMLAYGDVYATTAWTANTPTAVVGALVVNAAVL